MTTGLSLYCIDILINGYLKQYEANNKLSTSIPLSLANIISLFYPRDRFRFTDPSNSKQISIQENGQVIHYKECATDSSVITVQIGPFLTNQEKCIHLLIFKIVSPIDQDIYGSNLVGFISKYFIHL